MRPKTMNPHPETGSLLSSKQRSGSSQRPLATEAWPVNAIVSPMGMFWRAALCDEA